MLVQFETSLLFWVLQLYTFFHEKMKANTIFPLDIEERFVFLSFGLFPRQAEWLFVHFFKVSLSIMINTIYENKKILQLDRTHSTEFDYAWLDMPILETILIEIMHRHHHCCRHLHHHVIMIINVDSARERKRCLTTARSCPAQIPNYGQLRKESKLFLAPSRP